MPKYTLVVRRTDYKANVIGEKGELIRKKWFDSGIELSHSLIKLEDSNGTRCYVHSNRGVLPRFLYANISGFGENGLAVVTAQNGKKNFIDRQGNLICHTWYDDCMWLRCGVGIVKKGKYFNLIDKDDNLLYREWFKSITILSPVGYIVSFNSVDLLLMEKKNGLYNIFNVNTKKMVFTKTLSSIEARHDYFKVKRTCYGFYNYMNMKGQVLHRRWVKPAQVSIEELID